MGNYKPRLRSASYTTARGERVFDTFETAEDLLQFLESRDDVYIVQNLDSPRATWLAGAGVYDAFGYSTLTLDYEHFVFVRPHLRELHAPTHGHVNYAFGRLRVERLEQLDTRTVSVTFESEEDTLQFILEQGAKAVEPPHKPKPTQAPLPKQTDLAAAIARFNANYGK